MTTFLTFLAVTLPVVAGLWWWTRHEPEPARCEFAGCRRLSSTRVRQWHPSGPVTIGLCEGHARRWATPVFDQELAPGTDFDKWGLA